MIEVTFKVRVAWVVAIVFWLAFAVAVGPFGLHVMDHTSSEFNPNNKIKESIRLFNANFPQYSNIETVIIAVASGSRKRIKNDFLDQVTKSVEKSVESGGWSEYVTEVMSYSKYKKDTQQFAGIFMSSDYYMSTIFVLVDKTNDERAPLKVTNFFSKEVLSYDTQKGRYSFLVTSLQSLVDASRQSSLDVIGEILVFTLPVSVLILVLVTNASIFVILGVVTLAVTMSVTMGLVTLISMLGLEVSVFAPPIVLGLTIFSTTWNTVVVVCNFIQYLSRGFDNSKAALNGMVLSIQAVAFMWWCFVSPSIGVISFLGSVMRSNAVLCIVAITISTVVPITFVPAVLGCTGSFFTISGVIPCLEVCRTRHILEEYEEVNKIRNSFLAFFYTKISQRPWRSFLIVVTCLIVLCTFTVLNTQVAFVSDNNMLFPKDSESYKAYDQISDKFPASIIAPYYMLFRVPIDDLNTTLYDKENFVYNLEYAQKVLSRYKTITSLTPTNVISLSYLRGWRYTWDRAKELIDESTIIGSSDQGRSYRQLRKIVLSESKRATYTVFNTNDDPGRVAPFLVPRLREISRSMTKETGREFRLFGYPVVLYDAWDQFMSWLGYVTLLTFALIVLGLCLITSAPIAVVRMLVTSMITFSGSLGVVVISGFVCVSFVSVALVYPGVVGVAFALESNAYSILTYYRKIGFDPRSSVVRSVYYRRFQALAGGILHLIAFAPFMLSDSRILFEIGFIHVALSLFSIVFVSYALSPALSLLWDNLNWWPQSFPVIYNQPTRPHEGSEILDPILEYVEKSVNADTR